MIFKLNEYFKSIRYFFFLTGKLNSQATEILKRFYTLLDHGTIIAQGIQSHFLSSKFISFF